MTGARRTWFVVSIAVVVLAYVGAYLHLRASHRIMNYSNSHHWVAEKRSPGHHVVAARDSDAFACVVFQPLMLVERGYHQIVDD
ncbi:MAG TPA: hypothetical protein P5186_24935 [Candidatus Paceibacterota bacterium]|nr:hypothetical protein [Verrucomicrobiota bacterium]HRY51309.1 hypothetical protein [Candidatus Paceibacterota bacterium]